MDSSNLQLVGDLSPELGRVLKERSASFEADVDRVTQAIVGTVTDYQVVADRNALREVRESVELNLRLWYHALLEKEPIGDEPLALVTEMATHRVHQGISLANLLRAYRVGSSEIWSVMLDAVAGRPELHREMLYTVSPFLMSHFDRMAREIAMAYANEMSQTARWRHRLRSEIWNVIRNRPDDVDTFRKHCEALGLDGTVPFCAVALRIKEFPELSSRLESLLDPIVASAARVLRIARRRLFRVVHADVLLVWAPLPGAMSALDFDRQLQDDAERIVRGASNIDVAGIGLPGAGPQGWGASSEQALKAAQLGRPGAESRVCLYSEIALDDAVGQDENTIRYFEAMVERLANEPNLLETLEAYFQNRQHRKATAGALDVHPNTLDYRLGRIETVLGARLDEPSWVARLHTALRRGRSRA